MKSVKNLLRDLDFYHCYGTWIHRDYKNIKIKLVVSKNTFFINFYDGIRSFESLRFKKIGFDLELIEEQILERIIEFV